MTSASPFASRREINPLIPAFAVAACGMMWGIFWYPMRWFAADGVGGAWVSIIFNGVALATPLPWLLRRSAWAGFSTQMVNGLLLGTAFSLYTVSLVMTNVIHAILLFYLTPVWSTLAGWLFAGQRLSPARIVSIILGFAGMWFILGAGAGIPVPRNTGDWTALASGLLWTAGTMRSYAKPGNNIPLPVFCFTAGGFMSAIVILAIAKFAAPELFSTGTLFANLPWIIALALVMFVPPNFLVLWAAQRIDSGRIGILLMTEVLSGAVSAAILSGEPFGLRETTGTLLIAVAGLVEVLGRRD